MQRLLYVLSAAGFALFLSGLYFTSQIQPWRSRSAFQGPILDLNHASETELRNVDGLGDFVEKILDERPFNSKIDLLERMIVSTDIYDQIKDRITVRHAA